MKKVTVTVFITIFITICLAMLGYKIWAVGWTEDGLHKVYDAQKKIDEGENKQEEINNFDLLSDGDKIINITKRNTLYQNPFVVGNDTIAYYCIERSQAMQYAVFTTYKVVGVYNIIGKNIYYEDGNILKIPDNVVEGNARNLIAKFAYILSKNQGHGGEIIDESGNNAGSNTTSTQELVWHYFNSFAEILGRKWGDTNNKIENFNELTDDSTDNDIGVQHPNSELHSKEHVMDGIENIKTYEEASNEYANSLPDDAGKEDLSINKNSTTPIVTDTQDGYIEFGPLNITYPRSINSLTVEDQSGSLIKIDDNKNWISNEHNISFYKYIGTNKVEITEKEIPNGSDFYIRFKIDDRTVNINKIKLNINIDSFTMYGARIVIMENADEGGISNQRLMLVKNYSENSAPSGSIEYDINIKGTLKIIKQDAKEPHTRLAGVQFKIKKGSQFLLINKNNPSEKMFYDIDAWERDFEIQADGSNQYGWTNIFTTDSNGEITIEDVLIGTYYAEEIGYTEESGLNEWYNINENKNIKEIKVIKNDMYLSQENPQVTDSAEFRTDSLSSYGKMKITYTKDGKNQKLLTRIGDKSYSNTGESKNVQYVGASDFNESYWKGEGWTDIFTANSNGQLLITNVAGGSYKIDTVSIVDNIHSWGNLNIYKRDSKTNELLPGVQFKIYRIKDGNKQYMNCDLNNNNVNDRANVNWTNDENSAYTYTTDNNGEITIYNIPVGTYYAEEIGYTEESGLKEWYNINENRNIKEIKVIKNDMYLPKQEDNLNSAKFWTGSLSSYGKMKITYTQDGKNQKLLTRIGDKSYSNTGESKNVQYVGASDFNESYWKGEGWTDIFTANSNGQLLITEVAGGSYKIDTLGIVYNNQTYTDFELIKIDETTKERLKGVTFELVYKSAFEDQILINYVGPNNINNSIYTRLKDNTENYNIGDVKYIGLNDWNRDKATWEANGWTSSFITDSNGTIKINNINVGIYDITETYNPNPYYDSHPNTTEKVNVEANAEHSYTYIVKNPQKYIDLMIPKIDADTGKGIKGVEFEVKYVNAEGKIEYVLRNVNTDELMYCGEEDWKKNTIQDDGTNGYGWTSRFPTNEDGIVYIKYLTLGEYNIVEVYNPDPHYQTYPNIGKRVTLTPNKDHVIECATFVNKRTHVDISGYVWLDAFSEKESIKNDLYYQRDIFRVQDENERKVIQDRGLDGVTVRLIDSRTGKVVQGKGTVNGNKNMLQTKTSEQGIYPEIQGGEYKFNLVMISQLQYYYVQFEYDGLIYQSVIPHIDTNNGSKASDELSRKDLDKKFDVVYSKGKNEVKFNEGKETIYYNETVEHKTSIKDSSACILTANTTDAGYTITYGEQDYENGTTEIRYINLGLYEKPQADLAVSHELDNVNVKVNGYEHIYKDTNTREPGYDAWNVGVKFKNDYTGTYKRAIYKADAEYESQDKSKELQLYLTYKIAIKNESTYLTKANSIVDYFDSNYTFVTAGTGINEQNEITGVLASKEDDLYKNENYKKVTIETNTEIEPGKSNYIYVQFKVGKDKVQKMLDSEDEELLYNIAEINSYTVYKDDNKNTVAAVDKDSVPGNAKASEVNTYEDDTEAAPPVLLELANARKIEGSVFLDSTSGELKTGEVREGNGIYDNGEETIAGVKVVLHELNNSIPDKEFITDENGNYSFDEFIPGQYTITYIWGDKTYKVQDYKGTIYDSSRGQSNKYWYKEDVDTRKTDAIDNYNTRISIDNQIANITNKTNDMISEAYEEGYSGNIINKMDSATPTMEFGVEYDTTITDGTVNRVEFIVKNVDFGIVERARQELDMTKRVSTFKITLANGQTLVDATVKKDGTLEGTTNHVIYMKPDEKGYKGLIKAEIDSELIEGATLEIGYEITAKNNSELDYASKDFYIYGTKIDKDKRGDVVTLKPSIIVDYLDKNLVYDYSNEEWKQISRTDLKDLFARNTSEEYLNTKTALQTNTAQIPDIGPSEEKTVVELKVSKLLASSENITFDNKAEIVKITTTGRRVEKFPDAEDSETVSITPSTGENRDYQTIIIISVISLICLTLGIVLIKKKAL